MKVIILFALLAACYAAPAGDAEVPIVRQDSEVNPDGSYSYSYETGNGINAQEQGSPAGESINVQGSYSYKGEDGVGVDLTYTADENGFQPQGAHLPQAPEVPEAILRSIQWNEAHPEEDQEQTKRAAGK